MKRSKAIYVLCALVISIFFLTGGVLCMSYYLGDERAEAEKQIISSIMDSFDWENFPWETFPYDSYEDFPWESIPWDKVPWDSLPNEFPWGKAPVYELPWDDMPENFPWNSYPWDKIPEDFDWNQVPWDKIPDDFDWSQVPWDKIPDDFDWNVVPWDNLPENFDWNKVPWDNLPENFDWNKVPWDNLPENFDWNRVPWDSMPPEMWTQFPWGSMPEDFPWQDIPWKTMPTDFWTQFPWENLPENFPWYVLPWLLISPDMVPDGVLPDDFYPEEWYCEHEFDGDWIITKNATCSEAGERYNLCKRCKRIVKEQIPPSGAHEFDQNNVCSSCGIRRIWLISGDSSKEYDGRPAYSGEISVLYEKSAQLLYGHSLKTENAVFSSTQSGAPVKVGVWPNAFTFADGIAVTDLNGDDMTENYFVVCEFGKLEITARHVTLSTSDRTKEYDGTPLYGQAEDVKIADLVAGDELVSESLMFGEGITQIGRRLNEVTAFTIRNAAGEDVTDCYSYDVKFGWLIVLRESSGGTRNANNAAGGNFAVVVQPRICGQNEVCNEFTKRRIA